ncbi:radical SAM family heme chaperone HemW [Panacibacter ginsenosidivorans]|uniref:Heme chaperone HemW n=1 Tax=Panacibacter ginsenosidivorans TaxID=1813871 RepID=A0A5B8V952_9BACT|nr:radical SAM family heme chaperone HemW [Panacibacter ginsenosidivorans]QEC67944.1 radical SAM family heme chaperone HemW [Panacibacter ginsenosidivorans]
MAGIYIHVPFCRKACHYCNFHFSTSVKQTSDMAKAICKEAELRRTYINDRVTTIYFGGGTPSLLKIADLQLQIEKFQQLFTIEPNAEITLEANPDDITADKLLSWKTIGINRLSIGVQSFFEEDLQWMNRAHNAVQALRSIQLAQQYGFDNITIDLIYGTPPLTDEKWKQNVEKAFELNVPHLSCYALTVEPKTALEKMIATHKIEAVDPERQRRQFELLMEWTAALDYEHYEISNFAKPGLRSKHNSSYWQGKPYLGLGPSAHSFNGISRQWNVSNNSLYIKSIEQGLVPSEIEELTDTEQLNEYIMTALRTIEGLNLSFVYEKWGPEKVATIEKTATKYLEQQMITLKNNQLILTQKGKLFADGIAASMFF